MAKVAFVGFGEVNTPKEVLERKCRAACQSLKEKLEIAAEVYPLPTIYEEKDVKDAIEKLKSGF